MSSELERIAADLNRRATAFEQFYGYPSRVAGMGLSSAFVRLSLEPSRTREARIRVPTLSDIKRKVRRWKAQAMDLVSYGKWCGPNPGAGVDRDDPVDSVDRCCEKHDRAYDRKDMTSGASGGGRTSMWSEKGFEKTHKADQKFADCLKNSSCRRPIKDDCTKYRVAAIHLFSSRARLGRLVSRRWVHVLGW